MTGLKPDLVPRADVEPVSSWREAARRTVHPVDDQFSAELDVGCVALLQDDQTCGASPAWVCIMVRQVRQINHVELENEVLPVFLCEAHRHARIAVVD